MGAECVSVNKSHKTSKIKDKFSEFRSKFYKIWSENPIYKFIQQDIDLIDRTQQDLVLKGPEFFNLENFINGLPKVDEFNKKVFVHLTKLYYEKLNGVLQGMFPDVGQFFLNVVIFLLSNPNMSHKKQNLAESFINCYLTRPKKAKKKKNKEEEVKKEEDPNAQPNTVDANPQPEEPQKKRLNLTIIQDICLFLVNFCRQILTYFILTYIFVLESTMNEDMFNFDSEVNDGNGGVIFEYEMNFLNNFKLVNRAFNKETFNNMWVTHLMAPFAQRIYYNLIT